MWLSIWRRLEGLVKGILNWDQLQHQLEWIQIVFLPKGKLWNLISEVIKKSNIF